MSDSPIDLAIIGVDPGGYVTALCAAQGIFGQATHLPKPRERK